MLHLNNHYLANGLYGNQISSMSIESIYLDASPLMTLELLNLPSCTHLLMPAPLATATAHIFDWSVLLEKFIQYLSLAKPKLLQ